ncbi:FKBP-type peptidyl-prolyl cis-trans isomerase [Parvularcula oceani]|uniref:FKBP-type peptidyl-prolyl cis-trans isomerase n=1 Tax=Parvularcula oceani TaxID=1247963 RepID=UPI00068B6618|nr:FKBP-type peptidyl-prolyl cis-trans isomerase [Parvularcula oceani]
MLRQVLAGASALALLAACGGDDVEIEDELVEADASVVEDAAIIPAEGNAEVDAFLAENAAMDGVTVTESGLQVETLEEGEGESPEATDVIRIEYEARFADGRLFDSSEANGAPVVLPSYEVLQLPGLIEAVPMMQEGERARFVLPPDLAFGEAGMPGGMVGPNEALIFDMTLVEVVDPEDEARLEELRAEEEARFEERRAAAMAEFEAMGQENAQASEAFLAETAAREGVETTESGLQYQVVEDAGDGESPAATDVVRVHYRGTLPSGEEFDSSYSRGQPATFPLNQVIPGWTEGVQLMDVGDTYRFFVPAGLAYGETGTPGGPIGPNQALIFDVELLGIEDAPEIETPELTQEAEPVD